jgi:hypothetical protein
MRGIISIFTATTAALAAAGALSAQQPAPRKDAPPPRREETRSTICYSTDAGKPNCQNFTKMSFDSALAKRAALGLQLSPTGSMRDTIGVFVARVTPKGPAENAGIVEGDRIVSINGVDLRVNSSDAGDSYASELPTRRLTREVGKIAPGKIVTLRVWSGGRIRDVNVTAGRASDMRGEGFGIMFGGGPGLQRMRHEEMPGLRENMNLMQERLREMPMRMREMDMAPMRMRLRENGGYGNFAPSRVRVIGPEGGRYIYRDSTGNWTSAKTKEERAKAEKAAAEKEKKSQKDKDQQ